MTHPATQLALHHARSADLRARAAAHRLAAQVRCRGELRTRLGWTLVEVGLRLATPPKPALAG
ncbi:hypothetical protein ACIHCM_19045 [Streptomyces sp. NPDC052023]|uniref:hypothetical protein n=1 Tax=Streptomyces sp. NPDC052023 TaxID=3365681 RepID=UPI0037CD9F7A